MRSEDYDLDLKFYLTRMKMKSDHKFNDKVKLFREIIVVIEEECFADIKLNDGATSPTALIKNLELRLNQKYFHVTQSDTFTKLQ